MKRTRDAQKTRKMKTLESESSIELSPTLRKTFDDSCGRVLVHSSFARLDSADKRFKEAMEYLVKEYGVNIDDLPKLSFREKSIATNLARLLKLIEEHLQYWSKKKAPVTQDGLHKAKTMVFGLLDAI